MSCPCTNQRENQCSWPAGSSHKYFDSFTPNGLIPKICQCFTQIHKRD